MLIGVSALIIGARLYLRLGIQKQRLNASDYFMCAAWIASVCYSSIDTMFYRMGALSPDVSDTIVGFEASDEDLLIIMKVSEHLKPGVILSSVQFPRDEILPTVPSLCSSFAKSSFRRHMLARFLITPASS